MEYLSKPEEVAQEIIEKCAPKLKAWEISNLRDEIALAIQNERELLESRLQVVDVQAGDTIFLTHPGTFSDLGFARINEVLRRIFPENKIIILEQDLRVDKVLRTKGEANEPSRDTR